MADLFYPLEYAVNWLVLGILNLPQNKFSEALIFFIFYSIKILLLLFIMIFFLSFLRTYISFESIRQFLKKQNKIFGNFCAACFGAVTPFCSCSSIPVFFGLIKAKIPLEMAFSFLVASPLINEYLVVIMLGTFGLKITAMYVISGLFLAVFAGFFLEKLNLEKYIEKDLFNKKQKVNIKINKKSDKESSKNNSLKKRIKFSYTEAFEIVKKIWFWILCGVGIGALIHGFVPEEFIHTLISKSGIFAVIIAVIAAIPLYANCAAIVPVAVVLFQKGVPLGTALAFMMSAAALSFPEAIILRKAIK